MALAIRLSGIKVFRSRTHHRRRQSGYMLRNEFVVRYSFDDDTVRSSAPPKLVHLLFSQTMNGGKFNLFASNRRVSFCLWNGAVVYKPGASYTI